MVNEFVSGLEWVHFVGIGGSGMSGLAEIIAQLGIRVSGSDIKESNTVARLAKKGIEVSIGHSDRNIKDGIDLVVYSSAVSKDNVEIQAAFAKGITVIPRSEMLAEIMRLRYGIAIAGTHGKTTTTSMLGHILVESGLDPTVIVGGRVRLEGTGARLGKSLYLVAEADEYDGSFLKVSPIVGVVTSLEHEHVDIYPTFDDLFQSFVSFCEKIPFFGTAVLNIDDHNVAALAAETPFKRKLTYGFANNADVQVRDLRFNYFTSRFKVYFKGSLAGEVTLQIPGKHNVRNALAALTVAFYLGIKGTTACESLSTFKGVHRRFELMGKCNGAMLIDDYAHHPTEVEATLKTARDVFPSKKILAVFQPHLYSRVKHFYKDFAYSLMLADKVIVLPVYRSRESYSKDYFNESLLVEHAISIGHKDISRQPFNSKTVDTIREFLTDDWILITLGAGDVFKIIELIKER